MKIVCLGDSTTAGTPLFKSPLEAPPDGAGDERSQFAYWLRQAQPEWQVTNCGVNGERSDQIADRFDRDVRVPSPDVVVIIAGVNDVYQGLPADHVTRQLQRVYELAWACGIRVVAGTIVPYNTATADQNARMHAINDWIRRYAADNPDRICLADTRLAAAEPGNIDRLSGSPDDLHPDIDGYRRMAGALEAAIRAGLARSQ
ncbi:MAG TPA: GDSL-type esterase/lipase family protein [Vicinamibacterales bacterium]|nr:GDSL-type esterase/lipase family protein [Vicinamibacterales bacterium]